MSQDEPLTTETVWNRLEMDGEVVIHNITKKTFQRLRNNVSQYKSNLRKRLGGHAIPQILYSEWKPNEWEEEAPNNSPHLGIGTLYLRKSTGTHKRKTRFYEGNLV